MYLLQPHRAELKLFELKHQQPQQLLLHPRIKQDREAYCTEKHKTRQRVKVDYNYNIVYYTFVTNNSGSNFNKLSLADDELDHLPVQKPPYTQFKSLQVYATSCQQKKKQIV